LNEQQKFVHSYGDYHPAKVFGAHVLQMKEGGQVADFLEPLNEFQYLKVL